MLGLRFVQSSHWSCALDVMMMDDGRIDGLGL